MFSIAMVLALSTIVQFFLFTTPFWCGVCAIVSLFLYVVKVAKTIEFVKQ